MSEKQRSSTEDIPATLLSEEDILDLFESQIKKMVNKYGFMAKYAVGGTSEDLISSLQMRTIGAYRDWMSRVKREGSWEQRTSLDAIKFISCRLRTYCLDLARYQRAHVEPGLYPIFDYVNPAGPEYICELTELEMWRATLNPIQKKLVEIWTAGNYFNKTDPIKSLVRDAKRQLTLGEETLERELKSIPMLNL